MMKSNTKTTAAPKNAKTNNTSPTSKTAKIEHMVTDEGFTVTEFSAAMPTEGAENENKNQSPSTMPPSTIRWGVYAPGVVWSILAFAASFLATGAIIGSWFIQASQIPKLIIVGGLTLAGIALIVSSFGKKPKQAKTA